MIAPTIYSDVDGAYYGPDKKVHQADGWVNYSTFSLWDTYRAAHPLFTYTEPERVNDMVKSFIAFYEQNGRLPVWNFYGGETDMMIGYHAVPVIVDAYLKGIGDFDAKKALDACIATANLDNYRGIGLYKELGYIPYNVTDHYNAENWSLSNFTNVLKTTRMYITPPLLSCSHVTTKAPLSRISKPMTIRHTFAKATDGNTFGLYSMTLTD